MSHITKAGNSFVTRHARPSSPKRPVPKTQQTRKISSHLLLAVSVGALTTAVPGIYGGYGNRGRALALPVGCIDAGGGTTAEAGETVTCLAPPDPISPIAEAVDDLTLIVGDATTPTNISGVADGVSLTGSGTLTLNVKNTGSSIASTGGNGVYIGLTSGDGVSVTSAGAISGNSNGVYVRSNGTGVSTVTVADVTATSTYGIVARNGVNSQDLTITSTGAVSGGAYGIYATNLGSGTLTITGSDVSGGTHRGIYAFNAGTADGLSLTASGAVSGATDGILVLNYGSGATSISVATVSGGTDDAIDARNTASGTDLTITATGSLIGGSYGIDARNYGTGATNISANDVMSATNSGIRAQSSASSTGGVAVTAAGTVTTTASDGVEIRHNGGGDATLSVNVVSAGARGVEAYSTALSAAMSINATGTVTAATEGIVARHLGSGDLTVSAVDVMSASAAVRVDNNGTGSTTVTVGDVYSTTRQGLDVDNAAGAGDLTIIATGTVTGGTDGVDTYQNGSGALAITVNNVTAGDKGINAYTDAASNGATITATGTITSGTVGADLAHDGSGDAVVSVNTILAGTRGLEVYTLAASSLMSVSASGTITAGSQGVVVNHKGTGDLAVSVADVTANNEGLRIVNDGGGATSVVAGNVSSTTRDGIDVVNQTTASDITISVTGDVTGATYGVFANNMGTGNTSISTTGEVTGGGSSGIEVLAAITSSNVAISSTGPVNGADYGIYVVSAGSGGIAISTSDATGTSGYGIYANLSPNGTSLSVTSTGDVSGGFSGLFSQSYGSGSHAVMSTGSMTGGTYGASIGNFGTGSTTVTLADVAGTTRDGVRFVAGPTAGDSTITLTGTATGGDDGVDLVHRGAGAMTVAIADATGADDGIDIQHYGTDVSLSATGTITGADEGIVIDNAGTGVNTITVSGAVSGTGRNGISATSNNGSHITVTTSGTVTGVVVAIDTESYGGAGGAIADSVTLQSGATITGIVTMNAGADTLNDAGGSFSGIYGGAGTDTVNFTGASRTISGSGNVGDTLQQFEVFNFDADGITLAGDHVGLDAANINSGTTILSGSLVAAETTIGSGAELAARTGSSLTGNLTNAGTLSIGNSPGTTTVNGNFTQTATGVLPIEIEGSQADQLIVTGNVTLDGSLDISFLGGTSTGTTTRRIIDGGGTLSGSFATVSGGSGLLINNSVTTDAALSDVLLTTTVRSASSLGTLTHNQSALGDHLIDQLTGSDAPLIALATAVGTTANPEALAAILYEMTPEVADLGLKYLAQSQARFAEKILDASAEFSLGAGSGVSAGDAPALASGQSRKGATAWGSLEGYSFSQDGGPDHSDFDGVAFEFVTGVSGIALSDSNPTVTFGFAGGYGQFDGDTSADGSTSVLSDDIEANIYHIGASLGGDIPLLSGLRTRMDTAVSFASGTQDVDMNFTDPVGGTTVRQSGKTDFSSVSLSARLALDGNADAAWPIQPFLQMGVTQVWQDGFAVGSGTATSLVLDDFESLKGVVGVGASASHPIGDTTSLSARAAVYQYLGDTQNILDARFAGSTSGTSFQTTGHEVNRQLRFDTNISHEFDGGIQLETGLFGERGDVDAIGGSLKVSVRF